MHKIRRVCAYLVGCVMFLAIAFGVRAADPIVVKAIDNDPENKLWNCETNSVPFGNQEIDRSRCFTFRYDVPPEGISSATVHIAVDTLGSLQDTDATIIAVSAPVEDCAWGQGALAGCVMLHGGFKGGEKSLNLDLYNIACDTSFPNSEENQKLVRAALESGVVFMLLEDDTSVYSAELVLNEGAPNFTCGTSEQEVSSFIPASANPAPTASASLDVLDTLFNPPQYLLHAVGHDTATGPVKDDRYLLYFNPPDSTGRADFIDVTGRTFAYRTDYAGGPYASPREVCAAEGARVGDTSLAAWNGGESFRCNAVAIAPSSSSSIGNGFERAATEFLTGTRTPTPPDLSGAAAASVFGALALAILAGSNYLLSSTTFVQSALKRTEAGVGESGAGREKGGARGEERGAKSEKRGERSGERILESVGGGAESEVAREVEARGEVMGERSARAGADTDTRGAGDTRRTADTLSGSRRVAGESASARGSAASETRGVTGAAGSAATMRGEAASQAGASPLTASRSASAGTTASTVGDLGALALDKSVEEGISSVPDASDLVKDKLVDKAEEREKRRRVQEQITRARELLGTQERTLETVSGTLKRAVDGIGEYDGAYRVWKQAEYQVTQTRTQLDALHKQLAALEPKKEEGA